MDELDAPLVDEATQEHRFTFRGKERDVRFGVFPEEIGGEQGWAVWIQDIPEPSIVHERPWPTVEAARDATVRAIRVMLELERVQREEEERARIGS